MFFNFIFFAAAASVLAENITTDTPPQNLPENLGNARSPLSHENKPSPSTSQKVANTTNQPGTNPTAANVSSNTSDVNKNTSISDVNLHNNTASKFNVTGVADSVKNNNNKTAALSTISNNTPKDNKNESNTHAESDVKAKTEAEKVVRNNTENDAANIAPAVSTINSKTDNNATGNRLNSTNLNSTLDHTNSIKNETDDQKSKPAGTFLVSNATNTTDGRNPLPSTPIKKQNETENVHGNGTVIPNNNTTSKTNVTMTSSSTATVIRTGTPKWKAILITALVLVAGCCVVVLVKKSLRSERGQEWLVRARRQTQIPGRDYEVEYLVIRDSDD